MTTSLNTKNQKVSLTTKSFAYFHFINSKYFHKHLTTKQHDLLNKGLGELSFVQSNDLSFRPASRRSETIPRRCLITGNGCHRQDQFHSVFCRSTRSGTWLNINIEVILEKWNTHLKTECLSFMCKWLLS